MVTSDYQSRVSCVELEYVEPFEEAVARALAKAKRHWFVEIRGEEGGVHVQAVCRDGREWSLKLPLRIDTPTVLEGLLSDAVAGA